MKKFLTQRASSHLSRFASGAAVLLIGMTAPVASHAITTSTVSLNSAPLQTAQDAPLTRADVMRTFKARCPGRVERLLGVALPSERPNFKAIGDICACATTSMEALPEHTVSTDYSTQAVQAALACSKQAITARSEQLARKALSPYLTAQGLDTRQITHFSQCAADTHWQSTLDRARAEPGSASSQTWWSTCSEQVGRKGMTPPDNLRD